MQSCWERIVLLQNAFIEFAINWTTIATDIIHETDVGLIALVSPFFINEVIDCRPKSRIGQGDSSRGFSLVDSSEAQLFRTNCEMVEKTYQKHWIFLIENIWDEIDKAVTVDRPTNCTELIASLQRAWQKYQCRLYPASVTVHAQMSAWCH